METTVKIEDRDGTLTYRTYPVDDLQFKRKYIPEKEESGDDDDVLPED